MGVKTCSIGWLMKRLALIFDKLRTGFDTCLGRKCTYNQVWCNEFWPSIWPLLDNLRNSCTANDDWPVACQDLMISMEQFYLSPDFELKVMCSLIQPGGFSRMGRGMIPQCSSLAWSTIKYHRTIQDCSSFSREQCISHMCTIQNEFRWRMKPRQLQETRSIVNGSTIYPSDYVLPGCESLDEVQYTPEDCPLREDVQGICDCLCPNYKWMPKGVAVYECPKNIDAYLMFGRFGVKDIALEPQCEDSLCQLFSMSRQQCPGLKLPNLVQCKALQLPHMAQEPCPWQRDSGEDGVLECLDGTRCRPDDESWSCCFSHKGRARCPRDTPIMCDTLCSGSPTEYCCEERKTEGLDKCTPRPCSPLLVPWEITVPPTTTLLTSTVPPLVRKGTDGEGFSFRLPGGSWIWLILIVPFFLGLFCVYLWHRAHKAAEWVDDNIEGAKTDAEQIADRFGPFHVCRKPDKPDSLPPNQKTLVKLEIDELPMSKPLGLELNECKVARVHAQGGKNGWFVGDTIVQVGTYPVSTFEEIWQRIQIERDRLPCIFLVERQILAPTYLDMRGQPKQFEDNAQVVPQSASKVASSAHGSAHGSAHDTAHNTAHNSRKASKELDSRALTGSHSATGSGTGAHSRTTSKGDEMKAVPSLRDAAMAMYQEEEEEDYANFAQPSSQDWWRECTTREEAQSRQRRQQPHDLWNANRVLENRRTIEITEGIRPHFTREELLKLMSEYAQIEDLSMGVRGGDGYFDALPWIRFRTVMGAETALTALLTGEVHMEDDTKHGEERYSYLAGERKQDRLWSVPAGNPLGCPLGAKHPKHGEDDVRPDSQPAHGFGEWWVEGGEEAPSEDFDAWDQWQMERSETPKRQPTLWEEARAKDHHDIDHGFAETLPYHAWLENAHVTHPEELGQVREWVCSVCKRCSAVEEAQCRVCGAVRDYRNSKLKKAAEPRKLLPTDGIKKTPDSRVAFKKDAWHRFVYTVEP